MTGFWLFVSYYQRVIAWIVFGILLVVVGLMLFGCDKKPKPTPTPTTVCTELPGHVVLCKQPPPPSETP